MVDLIGFMTRDPLLICLLIYLSCMLDVGTHPVFSGSKSVKRSARNNTKINQLAELHWW